MIGRRHLIIALLGACVALPVIIGASCPPPSNPFIVSLTTNQLDVGTQIPSCLAGFVCVSIVNTACVDVEIGLFVHDGFDTEIQYPAGQDTACCSSFSADVECPCPREGYQVGEVQLTRPELFEQDIDGNYPNLHPVDGRQIRTLQPNESVLVQIQEGDIKTFGVMVGQDGALLAEPEISDGPRYRCTLVPIPTFTWSSFITGYQRVDEDVPSGETFQFVVYDQSDCAAPGLARLATRTGTSSGEGCPAAN